VSVSGRFIFALRVFEEAKHEVINARMCCILSTSVREKRLLSAGISLTTLVYTPSGGDKWLAPS
jgi:hypothetical protein